MKKKDILALDSQICFDLYSTSLAMTQVYKPLLKRVNLTYTQYLVLLVLWQDDGVGLKEIAKRLFQKPGALTPVIKRLEKEGILTRERSTLDERNMLITLTPKGAAMRDNGMAINECIFQSCGMDTEEIIFLSEKLKQLRYTLQRVSRTD
jgi:DNA-binding MarR family transcriptional regulator